MTSQGRTVIRDLNGGDASQIFAVLESGKSVEPGQPKWTYGQLEAECREHGLVLTTDNRVVAFVLWRESVDVLEISYLATHAEARGQGHMKSLLGHLKAKLLPEQAIWLEVHEGNAPARALYQNAGFVQSGQRPRYYADGGTAILYNYQSL